MDQHDQSDLILSDMLKVADDKRAYYWLPFAAVVGKFVFDWLVKMGLKYLKKQVERPLAAMALENLNRNGIKNLDALDKFAMENKMDRFEAFVILSDINKAAEEAKWGRMKSAADIFREVMGRELKNDTDVAVVEVMAKMLPTHGEAATREWLENALKRFNDVSNMQHESQKHKIRFRNTI